MKANVDIMRKLRARLAVNYLLIALALVAVGISVGLWWWNSRTHGHRLSLAAGIELVTRKGLIDSLTTEAAGRGLEIEIRRKINSSEALQWVAQGELDAAVIPAGLSCPADEIRQVAVFDREPLQLFVRPELVPSGIGGLRGKRIFLGSAGSGTRAIAEEVLSFVGLKSGEDFTDFSCPFPELMKLSTQDMPDALFILCPLPSPLGERLARRHGFQLMELPFGAAMALRRPLIEDMVVPAYTYSTWPAVPDRALHTIAVRPLLVANAAVSPNAIRRLLEVLYESELANRAGLAPVDDKLVQRPGEYTHHAGTLAYLHRNESWINKDLVDRLKELRGMVVSAASALLLFWQWYRRRGVEGPSDYLQACAGLELEARRAWHNGSLDASRAEEYLRRFEKLRLDVLEKHQAGVLPSDAMLSTTLARLDYLHDMLQRLPPATPRSRAA